VRNLVLSVRNLVLGVRNLVLSVRNLVLSVKNLVLRARNLVLSVRNLVDMKTRPLDKADSFASSATWSSVKLRCYTPQLKSSRYAPGDRACIRFFGSETLRKLYFVPQGWGICVNVSPQGWGVCCIILSPCWGICNIFLAKITNARQMPGGGMGTMEFIET
jgi:hypothetical protein